MLNYQSWTVETLPSMNWHQCDLFKYDDIQEEGPVLLLVVSLGCYNRGPEIVTYSGLNCQFV